MDKKTKMKQYSEDMGDKKYSRIRENLRKFTDKGYMKSVMLEDQEGKIVSESYISPNTSVYLRRLNEETKQMVFLFNGNDTETSNLIKALEIKSLE